MPRITGSANGCKSNGDGTGDAPRSSPEGKGELLGVGSVGLLGVGSVAAFPVEAFPKALQRFILSIARALPCPPDYPGSMMLPVLSSLIGLKRRIEIRPSWREYAGPLFVGCVARSGDRKSPVFEKLTEPMRRIQNHLKADYIEKKHAYMHMKAEERKETEPPRLKQIYTTDSTIEALKDVLDGNPNGVAYLADELSSWVRAIGQYKGGRGDDRQHWLSIWSLMQIVCNRRKNPEPIIIDKPFVCVTGGIQPDALKDLIDDAREDGFSVSYCPMPIQFLRNLGPRLV